MPPHGGDLTYTDTEIERAITYMVNRSGGQWTEPVSRTAPAAERTGEQIVQAQRVSVMLPAWVAGQRSAISPLGYRASSKDSTVSFARPSRGMAQCLHEVAWPTSLMRK